MISTATMWNEWQGHSPVFCALWHLLSIQSYPVCEVGLTFFCTRLVKKIASTDDSKRVDKETEEEVHQKVDAPSVQAQLHNAASPGVEGGKQGAEDTFPSVQEQLDQLRPLVNSKVHLGATW